MSTSMRDWLSHRAGASPEATGLIALDEGRELSYRELDEEVTRTAGRLATLGVGSEDRVGLVLQRRAAAIRLLWAVFRLGGVLVPLNPELDASALGRRLEDADVTTLVCSQSTEAVTADAAGEVPVVSVDEPATARAAWLAEQRPSSIAPVTWLQSDEMTVVYTAGATREPRPVSHEMGHHFDSAVDAAFRFGVSPTDRWLVRHPLHHVCGLSPVLRAPLAGNALVLARGFDAGSTADAIAAHRVTAVSTSPPDLQAMLDARGTLSDSLRVVVTGGTAASQGLLDRCLGYSVPVYHTYCLTEAAGEVAAAGPPELAEAPGSVGRPLLRTEVTVVDEDGTPVPRGETGLVVVSGPSVTTDYYDSRDEPADPEEFARGVPTGDLGYRDEGGRLWLVSRLSDRIDVDGEAVRAADVVEVLTDAPGVDDAAVVGIPAEATAVGGDDEEAGERPAALVVVDDPAVDADALEAFCRERVADFVVPVAFVFAEALPRLASGAVDRRGVRERVLAEMEYEPGTDPDDSADADRGDEPGDRSEEAAHDENGDEDGDHDDEDDDHADEDDDHDDGDAEEQGDGHDEAQAAADDKEKADEPGDRDDDSGEPSEDRVDDRADDRTEDPPDDGDSAASSASGGA